jgi:antitoxin (DNA-binding transcriptional repressor) of toxin-antitoxin stability system/gas vesicle protein
MKNLFLFATILILTVPVTALAQIERQPPMPTEFPLKAPTPIQIISPIEIRQPSAIEITKTCKVDEDCTLVTICPAAIGIDTPMCVEGKCTCGPGRKYPVEIKEEKIRACIALREKIEQKIKELGERLEKVGKEVKDEIVERLSAEYDRLQDEYFKECAPKPPQPQVVTAPPVPVSAVEEKVKVCVDVIEKIRDLEEKAKVLKEGTVVINEEMLKEAIKLREQYKECFALKPIPAIAIEAAVKKVETVDKFREEMKQLQEAMLNEITTQNLTAKELAEAIKKYNEERRELVKTFVEKIQEINTERMEEIKEVVVAKAVKWENETLVNVTKVTVTVNGKSIAIEPGDNVTITVEGVVVRSAIPLKVRNNTIEDAETNATIKETPEKVVTRIKEEIREMSLDRKQGIPVYAIHAVKPGKFFGIIPVNVSVNYDIAATDGKVIAASKPWWAFLVFG